MSQFGSATVVWCDAREYGGISHAGRLCSLYTPGQSFRLVDTAFALIREGSEEPHPRNRASVWR